MNSTPCYGCTERHYNCHAKCGRYISYKAEHTERKAKENAGRTTENYFGRKIIDSCFRKIKYKKCKTRRYP